jgi:hypothetical protein
LPPVPEEEEEEQEEEERMTVKGLPRRIQERQEPKASKVAAPKLRSAAAELDRQRQHQS